MGLSAAAGLIALGALTPGPNNLIVLRESARYGWKAALPAIAGVVAGGLALLGAVSAGAAALLEKETWLAVALAFAASALLAGLGLKAIVQSFRTPEGPGLASVCADEASPEAGKASQSTGAIGFTGLFVFQFLNPKAWILVVGTVASVAGSANPAAVLDQLVVLFVCIPSISLALWSWAGALAQRQLERRSFRVWSDRVTGGLLIGFAIFILIGAHHVG